jgi:hypothetical protein
MKDPSKKRQLQLWADGDTVELIYDHACKRWGKAKVDADLTRIWDMRCIMGMHRQIPFGSMVSTNLAEVLWVAKHVCQLGGE